MDSCRTCLREAIADRGYYLFDAAVRTATDLLMACTTLKILKDDGLPTSICAECYAKLTSFQTFCQLSIESDLLYRKNRHVKVELAEDEQLSPVRTFCQVDIVAAATTPAGETVKSEANWQHDGPETPQLLPEADDGDDDGDDGDDNDNDDRKYAAHSSANDSDDPSGSVSSSRHSKRSQTGKRKRPFAPRPGARAVDKSVKYTCDMCGKFYYEKDRLTGHLRQHCGLRPFPCDQCPKQYDKYSKLRVHQQTHAPPEPEQPTPCPHEGCGKSYRHPRYAQDHYERIHLGLRPKVRVECMCDTCGKSFMTRSSLLQHMKSHMDIEQYPYQCEVCGKRFLAKNGHTLHMLRHNNIRNFPCPLCPARMVSQLELNYHVAKHDKSVPWPCPECTMVFQRKASLRRHELKVHRGYKPYVCSFCSRAFGKKLSLINHERLHTGERPYACPICDRRFVQLVHMKSHVKTHNKNASEADQSNVMPVGELAANGTAFVPKDPV